MKSSHSDIDYFNLGAKQSKLVMTLLVRNEEDIVRYNIDFHLSKGVDFIIATDNGSTDSTRDILREYEERGVLHLIDEPTHNHNQAEWNNRMAEMARAQYGADIIFHCDADEFWYPRSGNLKDEILKRQEDILVVDVVNVLLEDKGGEEAFPKDTKFAVVNPIVAKDYQEETKHKNLFYFKYPPKVVFKPMKKLLFVAQGNHFVTNKDETITEGKSHDILIYHYPIRSRERFFKKVIKSGGAYGQNDKLDKSTGFHARRWYASYKEGLLDEEYKKLIIHDGAVAKLMQEGFIEEIEFNSLTLGHEDKYDGWRFFNRKFEYEDTFQDFYWPWTGHKYFAYDLIRNFRPKLIVDLGTQKGTSLFSFCQAIKDAHYDARLYAVDTWRDDKHERFYNDNVFKEVNEIIEKYYGGLKVNLLRKNFDEAVSEFENNSLDLLHIDGLHTYTAVKHDFERWFPKVKNNGIILMHDIFVSRDDFGVYKFWEELKREYKTIEFHQSYGLGVLFKDSAFYQKFLDQERDWQIRYSYIAEDKKNEEINRYLNTIEKSLAESDAQITDLYHSTSWRITWLLRIIGQQLKRFRHIGLRRRIACLLGIMYWQDGEPKISQGFAGEELQIPGANTVNPLISVVMPIYNACRSDKKHFLCALKSIANQSYKNVELIIVDDGSTDDSRQAYDDFLSTRSDLRARYFSKKNGGQSSARNFGVKHCSGEYIAFIDQDDEWYNDKLDQVVPWLSDKRIDVLYTDADTIDEDGNIVNERIHQNLFAGWPHPKKGIEDILFKDVFVMPGVMIMKKETFEKVGGFDENLSGYEDDDLFLRLFESGRIFYLPEPTLRWRFYGDNYSFSSRMLKSRLYYWRKLLENYTDNGTSQIRVRRISRRFFLEFIYRSLDQYEAGNELYKKSIDGACEILPYLSQPEQCLFNFAFLLPLKCSLPTLVWAKKILKKITRVRAKDQRQTVRYPRGVS